MINMGINTFFMYTHTNTNAHTHDMYYDTKSVCVYMYMHIM